MRVEQELLDRAKCVLGELPKLAKQFSTGENLEDETIENSFLISFHVIRFDIVIITLIVIIFQNYV